MSSWAECSPVMLLGIIRGNYMGLLGYLMGKGTVEYQLVGEGIRREMRLHLLFGCNFRLSCLCLVSG